MFNKPLAESKYLPKLVANNPELKAKNLMLESTFLTRLVQRRPHLKNFVVHTAYPNFGITNNDKSKAVIFSHGHFIESLYHLITTAMDFLFPDRGETKFIYQIETENFAWIDFFWSSLGRSGGAGKNVELVYNKMLNRKNFEKLIVDSLLNFMDINLKDLKWYDIGDKGKVKLIKWAVNYTLGKVLYNDKSQTDAYLGDEALEGLKKYIQKPASIQLYSELKTMPDDITFIFGHTHKPFQTIKDYNLTNVDNKQFNRKISLYNSGGWVAETTEESTPIHGGSAVIVDDDFNIANLRMYNEGDYKVKVEQANRTDDNPLFEDLSTILKEPDVRKVCQKFSTAVKSETKVRKAVLKSNIENSKGYSSKKKKAHT